MLTCDRSINICSRHDVQNIILSKPLSKHTGSLPHNCSLPHNDANEYNDESTAYNGESTAYNAERTAYNAKRQLWLSTHYLYPITFRSDVKNTYSYLYERN
jgi:hypothetical protein